MNSAIIDKVLAGLTAGGRAQSDGKAAAADAAQEAQARRPALREAPRSHPTAEAVKAAAAQIESYLRRVDNSLQFDVDSSTGETIVRVRNNSTGEVVRQIPNEEVLRIAACLESSSSALLSVVA